MSLIASGPAGYCHAALRAPALATSVALALLSWGAGGGEGPPAGAHPGPSGDFSRTVVVSGVARNYLLHVPVTYRDGTPAPLVLLLHGGTGTAANVGRGTGGFSGLADRHGFFAAYPDSKGGHRDDGRPPGRRARNGHGPHQRCRFHRRAAGRAGGRVPRRCPACLRRRHFQWRDDVDAPGLRALEPQRRRRDRCGEHAGRPCRNLQPGTRRADRYVFRQRRSADALSGRQRLRPRRWCRASSR